MCLYCSQLQINNPINKSNLKWCDRKGTPCFPTGLARQGQTGATSCAVEKNKGGRGVCLEREINKLIFLYCVFLDA